MGPIRVQPRERLPGTDARDMALRAANQQGGCGGRRGLQKSVMFHGSMFTPHDVCEINLQIKVPQSLIEVAAVRSPGSQEKNHLLCTDEGE